MQIRIPIKKVLQVLEKVNSALASKKITLKELQSLTGSLAFCAKAMPSARAFLRWPESWNDSDILRGISFLELVPVALAVFGFAFIYFKRICFI